MDIRWVKIRAWHAVKWHGELYGIETYCGIGEQLMGIPVAELLVSDLPAEKSCESCLRIVARLQDA